METQEEVINFADRVAFELNRCSLIVNTATLGFYLFSTPDVSRGIQTVSEILLFAGTLVTLAGISLRLRFHVQEIRKGSTPSLSPDKIEDEVNLFQSLPFQNLLMVLVSTALSMHLDQLFME